MPLIGGYAINGIIKSMKSIYNHYDKVMDDSQAFDIRPLGEGMMSARNEASGETYLINLYERQAWMLVDSQHKLVRWSHKDIDFNEVNRLPDNHHARYLQAPYGLQIGPYKRGRAKVRWTLCPAGQYYTADRDGFDMQDNEEINIHAIIDRKGCVVQPFQP